MPVKLVSKSLPLIEGCNTAQDFITYCARVSNIKNQENYNTAEKLLKYLVKHQHWSPFEMVSYTFEIITTRDIGRQILRHKSFSYQEFSQRYAEVDETSFVTRETRFQDKKNRQNSIPINLLDSNQKSIDTRWKNYQKQVKEISKEAYQFAIQNEIAKEQARVVLPEGLTLSRMYMHGTLRSWIHYCGVRMKNGTQKEHAQIAEEIWNLLLIEVPALNGLLEEIGDNK